jgi:transcriptional regulator with PAS, ATPase and Fis domain
MDGSSSSKRNASADALILESLGVAILAVDKDRQVTRFNPLAEQLTGISSPTIVGRPCYELLQTGSCPPGCPLRESLSTGTSGRLGMVVLQPAGRPATTIEMTASALFGKHEEVVGAVAMLRDFCVSDSPARFYGSRVFVSCGPQMHRIFDSLPRLASSDAPLLILGQAGSGRAALAETVHRLKKDYHSPLVRINCTGLKPGRSLKEELGEHFAHRLRGRTLLLEEIGDAPAQLQQELLAWIEDEDEEIGVRVISTATDLLDTHVKQGHFRKDLYYRLNVLQVAMPSLLERKNDIPLLVDQFIDDLNHSRSTQVQGVTAKAMQCLIKTDFPGNVRQLRQVLEKAHSRQSGPFIDVDDLPKWVAKAVAKGP